MGIDADTEDSDKDFIFFWRLDGTVFLESDCSRTLNFEGSLGSW